MTVEEKIKLQARRLGFDLVGITSAEPINFTYINRFKKWLIKGCQGKMTWIARNVEKRFNPALLLPDAQSVICTALNYKPKIKSRYIASYALYQDYHKFIREKLFKLADFIQNEINKNLKFKICVDSAPLAEKLLAHRCGLGFIGRNYLLTNPQIGSFLLLGELITNLPLRADKPLIKKDFCKNCTQCIDACPTGAIAGDNFFDARRCISYLTIEHTGKIPQELKSKIGSHLFGCDECLSACPYNKDSPICQNKDFKLSKEIPYISIAEMLNLTRKDFDRLFADSPIKRAGIRKLKRNALICISAKM